MEAKPDFKSMSTQKKIGYVWDYYRLHIGITIILAIIIGSAIHHFVTTKDSVLDMIFMNSYSPYEGPQGLDEFFLSQGFDAKKEEISIATSLNFAITDDGYEPDYYTLQSLDAMFAVGDVDIFAAPQQIYSDYSIAGYVADLRTVFTDEELNAYKELLLYATTFDTQETIPCGFDFSNNGWLLEYEYYSGNCHMGIPANADNPELAKEFLLYLLQYEENH